MIYLIIFKKLNNVTVLYSLMGVNKRLDKIVHDYIFTNSLTLYKIVRENALDLVRGKIYLLEILSVVKTDENSDD